MERWTALVATVVVSGVVALVPTTHTRDTLVCSGNGVLLGGVCSCFPGFVGQLCSQSCVHGTLVQGACQCDAHYSGEVCNVACSGHGDVVDGACRCHTGFSGVDCTVVCGDRGALTSSGVCVCDSTWTGSGCEERCNGRGQVTAQDTCACDFPYSGPSCTSVCNGRNTTEVGASLGLCPCPSGVSGKLCDVECSGFGRLVDGRCVCQSAAFSGARCETVCSGEGELHNGQCVCHDPSNTDPYCRVSHQRCDEHGTCVCEAWYGGDNCAIPCSGHGFLSRDQDGAEKCFCDPKYGGSHCQEECSGVGKVVGGECVCPALLGGSACQSVCSNKGVILVTLASGTEIVVPPVSSQDLFSLPDVSPSTTATDLARAMLQVQDRLSLPAHWQVHQARCACLHPHVSGSSCRTVCQSRGSLTPATETRLWRRVRDCATGASTPRECSDPRHGWTLSANLPVDLPFLEPMLDPGAECECDDHYGSDSQSGCHLCSGPGAGILSQDGEQCECINGHSGTTCERPCNGFGLLQHGSCNCEPGITGELCEHQCEFLCKGGTCDGEECICDEGFSGAWCDTTCYERHGEQICEQVFDTFDKPRQRSQASPVLTVLAWVLGVALAGVVAVIAWRAAFVDCPKLKRRQLISRRSNYITQREAAGEGDHPGPISLEDAPQYDDYYNSGRSKQDPNFSPSPDHRLDDERDSDRNRSDDEVEVDLRQFRSP